MPSPQIELIARAVLVHGSYLLACKNPRAGCLYLPGGHIEFGESAATALTRELQEETGLEIRVGELGLITEERFTDHKGSEHHEINLVFHVEPREPFDLAGSTPPPPIPSLEDKIAFQWIDMAAIVDLPLYPDAIRAWLVAGAGSTERGTRFVSEMTPAQSG